MGQEKFASLWEVSFVSACFFKSEVEHTYSRKGLISAFLFYVCGQVVLVGCGFFVCLSFCLFVLAFFFSFKVYRQSL